MINPFNSYRVNILDLITTPQIFYVRAIVSCVPPFRYLCHHAPESSEHYFVLNMGTQDIHGKIGHRPSRSWQSSKREREVTD